MPVSKRVLPLSASPFQEGSLTGRVSRGLTWTLVETASQQGLNLLVFLILARLLSPTAFGVVALASVFVAFAQIFIVQGLGFALIQRHDLEASHVDSAFWASIAISVFLTLVMSAIAGPVAALLNEPDLGPILQLLSLTFILFGLSSVQIALLRRTIAVRELAVRAVLAVSGGGIVGVALALMGAGAYALVGQQITFALLTVLAVWWLTPWRPRFRYSLPRFLELVRFGTSVIASDVLSFIGRNADNLLIGVFLGTVPLGFYAVGYRILDVTQTLLANVARNVAFPALSRLQADAARMRTAYLRIARISGALIIPGYVLLALVAPELTVVLLGDRWTESGRVVAILFLIGPALSVQAFSASLLYAADFPNVVFRFRLISTVVNVAGFLIAVRFGITAVAAAFVLRGYLLLPLLLRWMDRHAEVRTREFLLQLVPVASSTLVMACMVLLVRIIGGASEASVVQLAVEMLVGLSSFVGSMWVIGRSNLRELVGLLVDASPPAFRRLVRGHGPNQ